MPWLKICPFSVVVFIGTAAAFVLHEQRKIQRSSTALKAIPTTDVVSFPSCNVVFVLVAPGVGKGTQCQLICERLTTPTRWVHLSAGDLLRAERNKAQSELGDEINACIAAGQLVRSEITCQLLENAMRSAYAKDKTTHFLIDGYPRSQSNMDVWVETMQQHTMTAVLDFVCPEETLIGRLLERGKSSGRVDDNLATVQKRFDTFRRETAPILEWFRTSSSIPVHTIPTDKPVEDVYKDTVTYLTS